MSDLRLYFVVVGVLLVLSVLAWIVRRILWSRGFIDDASHNSIPELNEVILRGDYFTQQIEHLKDVLNNVQSISDNLINATDDWMERYRVFEEDVSRLHNQKQELEEKVDSLENVPLPALDQFVRIMDKEGKKGAVRDYALFFAGVVASILVTIVLRHFGI